MKKFLLTGVLFGAMTSVALAETSVHNPRILNAAEMDGITAGVAVLVDSSAAATGDSTFAASRTRTTAIATPGPDVGFGVGHSRAFGCCGSGSDASAGTTVAGDGDLVFGHTYQFSRQDLHSAYAFSAGVVLAVDLPD